jgi:hypothetical protein
VEAELKQAQSKIVAMEKEVMQIVKKLNKEQFKRQEANRELHNETQAKNQIEALLLNQYRRKAIKIFKSHVSSKELKELQIAAASQNMQIHTLLLRANDFMKQFPKIAHLFKQYVDIEGGEKELGDMAINNLSDLVDHQPIIYLGDSNYRDIYEAYRQKSISCDYDVPHALEKEVEDIAQEIDSLGIQETGEKRSTAVSNIVQETDGEHTESYSSFIPAQNPNHSQGLFE